MPRTWSQGSLSPSGILPSASASGLFTKIFSLYPVPNVGQIWLRRGALPQGSQGLNVARGTGSPNLLRARPQNENVGSSDDTESIVLVLFFCNVLSVLEVAVRAFGGP